MLKAQYERTWLLEDVEERIRVIRDGLKTLLGAEPGFFTTGSARIAQHTTNKDPEGMITCLYELSVALGDRFRHTGQTEDLKERMELLELALSGSLTLEWKDLVQCELGAALRYHSIYAGDHNHLLEAYKIHASLLDRHPEGSPIRPRLLYELALTVFDRNDPLDDATRCSTLLDETLRLLPESDPRRYTAHYILAADLVRRFPREGDISLLHAAVTIHRRLICVQPSSHPDYWMTFYGLGTCLANLYEQTGDLACLTEAEDSCRRAYDKQNFGSDYNRVRVTLLLTWPLLLRYFQLGDIQDLHECIRVLQPCRGLNTSQVLRSNIITQLAVSLYERYCMLGKADDLDDSIGLLREGLTTAPQGRLHAVLNNLSGCLQVRYERDGMVGDMVEAIDLCRECVSLSQRNYAGQSIFNLADVLSQYHEDVGDTGKLEEAIEICETWLTSGQRKREENRLRGSFLHKYAKALMLRYSCYHRIADLNSAASCYEEALKFRPVGHSSRYESLTDLADVLVYRFEATHSLKDISRAEDLLGSALDCLPVGNLGYATVLFKMARLHLLEMAPCFSVHTALENLLLAVKNAQQNAPMRLTSALDVFKQLEQNDPSFQSDPALRQTLLNAYMATISLLPRVAYFGLDITSRLRVLAKSDSLAADGAAHALLLGQAKIALEMLEHGRGVFWSQHLRLRSEFNALPSGLAAKLSQTALALERGSTSRSEEQQTTDDDRAKVAREVTTSKQRRLGDEFEALISQARALPGFERFMLPETFHAIGAAAARGPVIVLLATYIACQAIVIESPEIVYQIPLPEVSLRHLQALVGDINVSIHRGRDLLRGRAMKRVPEKGLRKTEEVLADLWRTILQRVIKALQMKVHPSVLGINFYY